MYTSKINDLDNSDLRKRFFDKSFVPENNLAVALIRVSTKKQERRQSVNEQREIIDRYCRDENLKVVKTFEIAETASDHGKRKHFCQMIDYVSESQEMQSPISHLVFPWQSRSNRNEQSARQLEEIRDAGVSLHFARDHRKLTTKSDFAELVMWHLDNIRNAAYIDELKKNVIGGTIRLIERGMCPTGTPPYGYKSVGRKDNRLFKLDGDKAEYMRSAFDIVASPIFFEERLTDKSLKRKLDRMFPHLSKTPDTKRFCELLRNPFYTGEEFIYANKVYKADPSFQPAIVSKAIWLKVQDVLSGRHKGRKLSQAHAYIGLMNCNGKILDDDGNPTDEVCGCSITAEQIRKKYMNGNTQEFNYYRCANMTRHCSQRDKGYMRAVIGRNVSYRQDEVEIIFQDMFKSFSFDEVTCQRMKKYLWQEHFEAKNRTSERLKDLQTRQYQLQRFIEDAYDDKLCGNISEEIWRSKNHKWEAEHQSIVAEMNTLKESTDEYMQRGVTLIELMQHAEMIFKNATPEKKRRMVEFVSSNLLLADGRLEYQWRIPFNMLAINGNLEEWRTRKDSNLRPLDS